MERGSGHAGRARPARTGAIRNLQRRFTLGHTVLIVDDAEFMRAMLREIVEEMELDVAAEAADGDEAVQLYHRHQPDLVLLDITMPGKDGTEALQDILAADPEATVVMITALGQKEQVLSSIKAGARDFIIKPFDTERVQDTLQRILPTCTARHQLR
jgi:two-component system chemotaxis response regulator CheY